MWKINYNKCLRKFTSNSTSVRVGANALAKLLHSHSTLTPPMTWSVGMCCLTGQHWSDPWERKVEGLLPRMWVVLAVVTSSLKINSYTTELAWQLPRNELPIPPVSLKAWQVPVRNVGAEWTDQLPFGALLKLLSGWLSIQGVFGGVLEREVAFELMFFSATVRSKLEEALSSCSVWTLTNTYDFWR